MHSHWLMDSDRQGDVVRVLYKTMPSLGQSALGNWTINVYIAELHPDGRIENRQLTTGQRNFESLLLQRGGDGVFAVVAPAELGGNKSVEFWSAQDGSVRDLWYSTALESAVPGIFPTDDGNFFVVTQPPQSASGDRPNTLTLIKLSPDGKILAEGEWTNATAISSAGGAFPVPSGGMGITLNMRLVKGAPALDTDIESVQIFEIGGRSIEARVFAETRLLATDATSALLWRSPALERDLMWDGDMAVPQDLPVNEMLAQNNQQMALMRRVTLESGGDRRIEHAAASTYDDIQRTPNGHAVLVRVAADRKLNPPMHGTWFIEIGGDGALRRELRIEPAAERLNATFDRFLPTEDGGLLVAGTRREGGHSLHLTALGPDGAIEWTARLAAQDVQIEGIGGTRAAPWVYGQGWNEAGNKNLMWAELVDSSAAERLPAASAAGSSAATPPRQQTPSAPAAPPTLELPEPAEGCSCTCEEYAAIQALSERMKTMSQAEMMAMVQSPAYQQVMSCTGGCAMAYMQCK